MKHTPYDRTRAQALLPLLGAIANEIQERTHELTQLEARLEEIEGSQTPDSKHVHNLVAEAAAHRRGIRLAYQELDRLGCSVLGTEPLTFRIPGRVGEAKQSFVWQTGDAVLK